ncbi:MAG: hypothetical protein OEZ02_00890 [Anaerolineae bacterium]|nr:hypothetical protein [Anaerolineae bacterium]
MFGKKETQKYVYDDDLTQLLKNLGVYGKFNAKKFKCPFCQNVITWDNLNSIFPDSGAVKLSCNQPGCVLALADRMNVLRAR